VIFQSHTWSGDSGTCYGLEVVARTLAQHGHTVEPFSASSRAPVLVSLYWPEMIYDFARWRYQAHMRGRRVIVGGNYATTSPQVIRSCDAEVFLGDGELYDGSEDNAFLAADSGPRMRAIAPSVIPFPYEDVQQTRRSFCEISRGCKHRCLFCQYGWLKPYREADITDIEEVVRRVRTKSVRVFAADRFNHSRYPEIRARLKRIGKCDTGSDITIQEILAHPEWLAYTRKVRVGVEGQSEQLRRQIGKPYTNDDIVRFCALVSEAGIASLDWYMIYGLPGETDADTNAFDDLLRSVDAALPVGFNLAIHFNAFQPNAQTPYQWAAAAGEASESIKALLVGARRPNTRIKLTFRPWQTTARWTMLKRLLAVRAPACLRNEVFALATNEARIKRGSMIERRFHDAAGYDLLGIAPIDTVFPWDATCLYERETMQRIWGKQSAKIATEAA
jgi:radical SAM superfamily enzyme YgiQ (UPF0313 family)